MKYSQIAIALALTGALASADTLGVYVSAGQWNAAYSGDIQNGADQVNIERDLGLSDDNQNTYSIAFEHPVPLLPNLKLRHQDLQTNGSSVLTRSFTYGNTTFSVSDTVTSDFDLSHDDYILYYEILDNWVSLDVGLNVKKFNGDVRIETTQNSESDTLDDSIPLLYARANFEFPLTGLSLDVEASGATFSGDSFIDMQAALRYETDALFYAELGYRRISLNADDVSGINVDLAIDGAFLNFGLHF